MALTFSSPWFLFSFVGNLLIVPDAVAAKLNTVMSQWDYYGSFRLCCIIDLSQCFSFNVIATPLSRSVLQRIWFPSCVPKHRGSMSGDFSDCQFWYLFTICYGVCVCVCPYMWVTECVCVHLCWLIFNCILQVFFLLPRDCRWKLATNLNLVQKCFPFMQIC